MPLLRRLSTVLPFFGTYVAKTWSKLRFSPMMTMTCLIGVTVLPSPGLLLADSAVAARAGPTDICNAASETMPTRTPRRVSDTIVLIFMKQLPK